MVEVMLYVFALLAAAAFFTAGFMAYFKKDDADSALGFCCGGILVLIGTIATYYNTRPSDTNKNVPVQTSTETQSKK